MNGFLDLKHPVGCCVFSFLWVFADFLNYMPNMVKNWKFCKKLNFLPYLAWNSKNQQRFAKNEKKQHLMRCFKSKKQFKINFYNFCQFLAHFEQKVAKNVFFVIFAKTVSLVKIWHYQCVPCEIPFLKMYTLKYFYEFVKKLCYKIKMSKRDV